MAKTQTTSVGGGGDGKGRGAIASSDASFLPAMFTSFNNHFVQDLFRHRLTQHPTTTAAVAAVAAAGTPTNCGATAASLKGVDCTAGGTIQGAQCVWKGRYCRCQSTYPASRCSVVGGVKYGWCAGGSACVVGGGTVGELWDGEPMSREYVDEHLYNIQCSEIFTLRNEKLHTET